MDKMTRTLRAYARQHESEHSKRSVLVYGNFTHCIICKDHAHYWKPNWMIRHNSDYSLHERIELIS